MLIHAAFEGNEVLILDIVLGQISGVEGSDNDILTVVYSDIATGAIHYSPDITAFTIIE